jgi:hypothetical protein
MNTIQYRLLVILYGEFMHKILASILNVTTEYPYQNSIITKVYDCQSLIYFVV